MSGEGRHRDRRPPVSREDWIALGLAGAALAAFTFAGYFGAGGWPW